MEYLQYLKKELDEKDLGKISFKPYYKWNTFNTLDLNKDIDFITF